MKEYATGELFYFDPDLRPAPKGVKLTLLTRGGIQVTGFWEEDLYVAWQYLFKIPQSVKDKMKMK